MKNRLLWIPLVVLFSCWLLFQPVLTIAQGTPPDNSDVKSNPKEGNLYVSATIAENTPPTTPILISPENNSYVTINPPVFVWQGSTDNYGVDYYQVWLDGELLLDNIPAADTDNSECTLDYDGGDNKFTLTPKDSIDQGSHTWKIRVFDIYHGDYSDSATWSFIVDTQAPSFVVTQIGIEEVSISAQDIDTIPVDPIQLEDNQPLLTGTGESNSTVIINATIPGDPNQSFTLTIDEYGNWQQQLPNFPRNEIITLDFIITDLAGNISVLNGVKLIILADTIVIPPASPSPTPTPGVTPLPTPPTTPPPTSIVIPILPPEEYIQEIIQEITEVIPIKVTEIIEEAPSIIERNLITALKTLAPTSSIAVGIAVPTIGFLAFLSQFGWELSWKIFLKILQAIGLLPKKDPQGLVFNSQTNEPVSYALLTVTSYPPDIENGINETVVTDNVGVYQGIKLPEGRYQIAVNHQDFTFPTQKNKPSYLPFQDFYKGEIFDVKQNSDDKLFLIPVDPIVETAESQSFKSIFKLLLARLRMKNLTFPLFVFSLIVAILFSSWINWIIVGIYVLVMLRQFFASLRIPNISGEVIDQQRMPIENAIIRISTTDSNKLITITHSDSNGHFSAFVDKGVYQINATKQGFVWMKKGSSISFQELDTQTTTQYIVIDMTPSEDVYQELFS